MGNIGFEVDSDHVKLVYIESDTEKINFIDSLKSKFLVDSFQRDSYTIYIFKFLIDEFLDYHKGQNVKLLREKYRSILSRKKLQLNTNYQTIKMVEINKKIMHALQSICMQQVKLIHKAKVEMSLEALEFLNFSGEYYRYQNTFQLTSLHSFNLGLTEKIEPVSHLPQKFILVLIRNGISMYAAERGKKIQRLSGSIIGEKTILAILKLKYPTMSIDQIFKEAFFKGNSSVIDMLVNDIYGNNSGKLGLPSDLIASSLGKIGKMKPQELDMLRREDVCRSILASFAINISTLTSTYLDREDLSDAVILSDKMHNEYFYLSIQSIMKAFTPNKNVIFCKHSPFLSCLRTIFKEQ